MTTIRSRLTRRLLPALVAVLLVGGALAIASTRAFLLAEFDETLRVRAQSLIALVEYEQGELDVEVSEELGSSFDLPAGRDAFQVWLPSGEVLTRSPSLGTSDLPRHPVAEDGQEIYDLERGGGRSARALAVAFRPRSSEEVVDGRIVHVDAPGTGPPLQLVVALDRRDLDSALGSFARGIVVTGAVLLIAVLVTVATGLRRGLAPLTDLAAEVQTIDASTLDRRLALAGQPDELAGIRAKLNELLERLEAAFDRERRFSSGAAHELRTPIAELRVLTEVALKWPEGRTEAESTRDLREAHAIACQMEDLVGALLAIARNGRSAAGTDLEPIELAPLVASALAGVASSAASRSLRIASEVPAGIVVRSSRPALMALLRNLAANAVEHAPAGTRVDVSVRADDGAAEVRFTNEDATLTESDLPRLFEPFWRKDESRTDSRHSGLGLAVGETLARSIGATLAARLEPPGHVTFTLTVERKMSSSGR